MNHGSSRCEACGATFPRDAQVCALCGGEPRRTVHHVAFGGLVEVDPLDEDADAEDRSVRGNASKARPLPPELRNRDQNNRWDMRRIRERVAALRDEERRAT